MVYLITGKAKAGKSTYAYRLAQELEENGNRVVVVDGDAFRKLKGNSDYSDIGRIRNLKEAAEYAASMEKDGNIVVCSFVSPRRVWRNMMRSHWRESQLIYIPGGELWPGTEYEIPLFDEFQPYFNQQKKYSMFPGRYQPFHDGHRTLVQKVLNEGKNICIAIRDTAQSKKDPHTYLERWFHIFMQFRQEITDGKVLIIKIPDIEEVCYGRKVGWGIREIRFTENIENISATKIREERG